MPVATSDLHPKGLRILNKKTLTCCVKIFFTLSRTRNCKPAYWYITWCMAEINCKPAYWYITWCMAEIYCKPAYWYITWCMAEMNASWA
jgi:hypothetical protein